MKQKIRFVEMATCATSHPPYLLFLQAEGYFTLEKWDKTLICIENNATPQQMGGKTY